MIRRLMNSEMEFMQVILGDGDVIVGSGKSRVPATINSPMLVFIENPNGAESCGMAHPELEGESILCLSASGVEVHFQAPDDIKALIERLQAMLEVWEKVESFEIKCPDPAFEQVKKDLFEGLL